MLERYTRFGSPDKPSYLGIAPQGENDRMKEHDWKVFTARNLAMRWGVSEREVRNLVRSGDLRGTYLARRLLRISRDDVLEYERTHPMKPMAPKSLTEKELSEISHL